MNRTAIQLALALVIAFAGAGAPALAATEDVGSQRAATQSHDCWPPTNPGACVVEICNDVAQKLGGPRICR